MAVVLVAVAALAAFTILGRTGPEQYTYRVVIDGCRITTPQLATAFAIDDRRLVSAAHPFAQIRGFEVIDAEGRTHAAEAVALLPEKDLALLRLVEPADRSPARLRDEEVEASTGVQIATFDRERQFELNDGFAKRRAQVTLDGEDERRAIELEADIVSGDSGAPVLFEGEVVGVVFATARGDDRGWAVALPELRAFLSNVPTDAPPLELSC